MVNYKRGCLCFYLKSKRFHSVLKFTTKHAFIFHIFHTAVTSHKAPSLSAVTRNKDESISLVTE